MTHLWNSAEYLLISHFLLNLRDLSSSSAVGGSPEQAKIGQAKPAVVHDQTHLSAVIFASRDQTTTMGNIGGELSHSAWDEALFADSGSEVGIDGDSSTSAGKAGGRGRSNMNGSQVDSWEGSVYVSEGPSTLTIISTPESA